MRDRAPIFVAFTDLLICLLCYVLVAVTPTKAKIDGIKPVAQFLVTAEWAIGIDKDVDLWVVTPSGKPVFYGSRQAGCVDLDHDDVGSPTSTVTLADGSQVKEASHKETTSIRCLVPGHYDVGVNMFSNRGNANPCPVHVEIVGLNPQVSVLYSGDVTLHDYGETINVTSFDLSADGKITLASPPLTLVTQTFTRPGTGTSP